MIFFFFFQKTGFDILCKLSSLETICSKFQNLFSGKNKKNISICHLPKILPRVLSINNLEVNVTDLVVVPVYNVVWKIYVTYPSISDYREAEERKRKEELKKTQELRDKTAANMNRGNNQNKPKQQGRCKFEL